MQPQTICKTVHQYNKYPVSGKDMNRLLAIAEDCQKVKNYVFQRYSGINSPLTDTNQYHRQIHIKLYPEESRIELNVPIDVRVRSRADYTSTIGIAMGVNTMLTADAGHCFGSDLGKLHDDYAEWVRMQTSCYHKNKTANPGRKKYHAVRGVMRNACTAILIRS